MSAGIRTRVAFHVTEGEIIPGTMRVRRNTVLVDVVLPEQSDAGDMTADVKELDGMWADPSLCELRVHGKLAKLTLSEMKVLLRLMDAWPRAATKRDLKDALGYRGQLKEDMLSAYISRLRRKAKGMIEVRSIWSVGWVLVTPEELEKEPT